MKMMPVCSVFLAGNEQKYVEDCMKTSWISSSGSYIDAFEEAFAAYCGVKHGIAVANGTVALHLALVALGVGPGDEVIIPDFTMASSAFAVCYTGAMPIFIDADPYTWNLNIAKIQSAITQRTKAIMPVHIFGNPCDMKALKQLTVPKNIAILEDAAEAHGAEYAGLKTGALGDLAAFSFFANKNITTGEGGMVATDSDELAKRCRYFKNVCFPLNAPRNYLHEDIGFNYRMSNLHAAIGLAQVERADYYCALRVNNGLLYRELLSQIPGIRLQQDQALGKNAFWMNGIVITEEYGRSREELIAHLAQENIDTRLFFNGMHRQPALQKYGCDCSGSYPVSDTLADHGFYLPSGSGLQPSEIEHICTTVKNFRR